MNSARPPRTTTVPRSFGGPSQRATRKLTPSCAISVVTIAPSGTGLSGMLIRSKTKPYLRNIAGAFGALELLREPFLQRPKSLPYRDCAGQSDAQKTGCSQGLRPAVACSLFLRRTKMRQLDLTPLYRSTVGFDRLFNLVDQAAGFE